MNIPILGICFGLQLIAVRFKGSVRSKNSKREFGKAIVNEKRKSVLTRGFFQNRKSSVWMSHQDAVSSIPKNFNLIGSTKDSKLTIIENLKKKIYGVQFHPEASHTLRGKILLKNFVFNICKIKYKWRVKNQKNILINQIRNIVKNNKVICALSGGVDSSVVAVLINKAIKKNLHCIMVDTGLMRKNEFKKVFNLLKYKHKLNIKLIDKSKLFVTKLKNIRSRKKEKNNRKNIYKSF